MPAARQPMADLTELFGLPLHPLVVHAVVVLVPLSVLGLVAVVLVRRWRPAYGPLVLAGFVLSALFAFLGEQSGEAFALVRGEPAEHAEYGGWLPAAAFGTLVIVVAWWLLQRSSIGRPVVTGVVAGVAVAAGLGLLGLTAVVGHTGAQAAWGGIPATPPTPAATGSGGAGSGAPSGSPTPSPGLSINPAGYSLAQIAEHDTAVSCWAAINEDVYDLTTWIQQHPGGANAIRSICGTDASVAFNNEHGAQDEPNQLLGQFFIGPLLR